MDIRSQISMVFHLDKCIGCHTCSIACKNIWTDRKGTEYMWWNNVETKPGTGFPTKWEDQEKYKGGWEVKKGKIRLKSTDKLKSFTNIFHNPNMPTMDDYYEPWTYDYKALFNPKGSDDQPTAKPISMVTGEYIDIKAGPNWDDDLSGSEIYAKNDVNLENLTKEQQAQMFEIERLIMFYFPRICNHCLNPACVASCPSGALYKRGEDGIVLIDQKRCRAWRSCVSACPYKKTYYNWHSDKSEKCILCFPRVETGQAPACFHSCVGRIRYLGVLLYDAEKIEEASSLSDDQLVQAQRNMILDPFDEHVIKEAKKNGIADSTIKAAQNSPVYDFVIKWELALPPHIEFRTQPMLFYVPPLLPVMSAQDSGKVKNLNEDYFPDFEKARLPIKYLANMFSGGNEKFIRYTLEKQSAVRAYRRAVTVGDIDIKEAENALIKAGSTIEEAEAIYQATSLSTFNERFVIPASHREQAIEMYEDPLKFKQETGFGFRDEPKRGL